MCNQKRFVARSKPRMRFGKLSSAMNPPVRINFAHLRGEADTDTIRIVDHIRKLWLNPRFCQKFTGYGQQIPAAQTNWVNASLETSAGRKRN